jgi:hypothetical protein
MSIDNAGEVSIGSKSNTGRLTIHGRVSASEMLVALPLEETWPEYVFDQNYPLLTLEDLKDFIVDKGHLPGIPTAEEVSRNGISLSKVSLAFLKQLEELTLHVIALNEQNKILKELIKGQDEKRVSEKKFLFVAGCPRSGTSALARLLSFSKDIVIGMERFGHLETKGDFLLTKSHFSERRFFDLQPGDTFYDDFESMHGFDPEIRKKYRDCVYIGDKRPELYEYYDDLFSVFPSAVVYFIYRDVKEVASSYRGRALKGVHWPKTKDVKSAVRDWNRSMWRTSNGIEKGFNIKCLNYESIFKAGADVSQVFTEIGLEYTREIHTKVQKLQAEAEALHAVRETLLREEDFSYIERHAKIHLVSKLNNQNLQGRDGSNLSLRTKEKYFRGLFTYTSQMVRKLFGIGR